MLVLVLTVNPGIKNYQSFSTVFCSAIQKELDFQCLLEENIETSTYEDGCEGVFLRSIDAKHHLSAHKDSAEIIKHNEYLENELLKVQEEARVVGTSSTLNKNQLELLKIHERHNQLMSIANIQLLVATRTLPKRIYKCTRPACATFCHSAAQRKSWRTKGKHNERILQKIKTLPGEIAHTDLMTSSVPGPMPQMVGFLTSRKFHYASFFVDGRSDYTFA